jgi:hypothetical protein
MHVRGTELPVRNVQRLASNKRWVSFVPKKGIVDLTILAAKADAPVVHVFFDDDAGVSMRFHLPKGSAPSLDVQLDDDFSLGREDHKLIGDLVRHGVLSAGAASKLKEKLRRSDGRRGWLLAHGVEKLFGFPNLEPQPVDEGLSTATRRAQPPQSGGAGSARQRAVAGMLLHYFRNLWSMNGWRVYNRLKKHLPAERRAEVDRLVDLINRSTPENVLRGAMESIVDGVWESDDLVAMIAHPDFLDDSEALPDDVRDWERRLAELPAA